MNMTGVIIAAVLVGAVGIIGMMLFADKARIRSLKLK